MRVPTLSPQIDEPRMPGVRVSESVPTSNGIERGFAALSGALEQKQLQIDRTAVMGADNERDQWLNDRLYNPQSGAYNATGANALGVRDRILKEFDDQVAGSMKNLRGKRQQQAYLESSLQHRGQLDGQLSGFESDQSNKLEDETASSRVQTSITTGALNYNDAPMLARARGDIDSTIDGQAKRRGWTPEMTAESKSKAVAGLHGDVIERMLADKRIGLASKYLDANKGELSSDDQLKYSRAIEAAGNEGRNEAQAGMRQQIADLHASYMAGLSVAPAQELSAGQIEFAFPGKGVQIYNSLQSDKRTGADLKAINTMAPDQVAKLVGDYKVTQGGAGAADAIDRQNEILKAVRASSEQREKNPAQFAIDNGLGYSPMPNTTEGVSAELKNRESVRASASAKVGVPVPLLTPDEAKSIGQRLDQATDKDAADTFSFFRNTLSDSGFKAVMQQISPDSPVKAYAGQIYGRPQPVLLERHTFSPDDMTSQRVISQTMVTGENLLNKSRATKGEDGKPLHDLHMPDKTAFDEEFSRQTGRVFAGDPEAQARAQQYAYAYLTGLSAQTGRNFTKEKPLKPEEVTTAIQRSVGSTVTFHGYSDVMPPLGYDKNTFENEVYARYLGETAARGVSKKDAVLAWPSLGLTNVKGRYMITAGTEPFALKGQPIFIDLDKPAQVVEQAPAVSSNPGLENTGY